MHNHHDVYGTLPPNGQRYSLSRNPPIAASSSPLDTETDGGPSALARTLPFIEAANVSASYDFLNCLFGGGNSSINPYYSNDIKLAKLNCIVCPSEGAINPSIQTSSYPGNYVVCVGSGTGKNSLIDYAVRLERVDGAFDQAQNNPRERTNGDRSLGSMTDGTSNTMTLSEALWNTGDLGGQNPNENWQVRQRLYLGTKADGDNDFGADPDLVSETASTTSVGGKQNRCEMWLSSRWDHSIFNAYLTPNQNNACNAANINNRPTGGRRGFFKAASQHRGGVNAAYGDGSVHFVSDNVNLNVWRGLSTVSGGESTSY
jgi:prepilin-type processing-associated H-X9-DG protein